MPTRVYPQEEEAQLFEALRASEREAERMKAMKSEVRAAREAAIRAAQAAEAAELRARHLEDRWKFEARSTPTKDWRPGRDVEVDFGVAMNARAGAWDEEDEDAFTLAEALRASEEEFERDRKSKARAEGERRAQEWYDRVSNASPRTTTTDESSNPKPPTPPSRQTHYSPVYPDNTHRAAHNATPPHLDPSFLRGASVSGAASGTASGVDSVPSIIPEELEETRQLLEALARSKEDAEMTEALRRSESDEAGRTSTSTSTNGVDVDEVTLRTDSPRSPKSPHGKTPRRRYKDEDFDLAGMAFRRTVFGPGERPDPSAPPAEDEFEDVLSPPRREKIYGDDVIEQRAAERAAQTEARLRAMETRLAAEKVAADARRVERETARLERERKAKEEEEVRRLNDAARAARAAEAAAREAAMRAAAQRAADDRAERERASAAAENLREDAAAGAADCIGGEDLPGALRVLGYPDVDAANPAAVKKAYKKAALRFHPDRTRGYTLEQRLNGEEVWKLLAQKMEEFNRRGL